MLDPLPATAGARLRAWLPFVLSAAVTAAMVRLAFHEPWLLIPFAALLALFLVPAHLARRKLVRVLRSGDVDRVLSAWTQNFLHLAHRETMQPLITAAAFAAYGWVNEARRAMDRSARGPAWDAALEHRLFVETLLDTYEGDRSAAIAKSGMLLELPVPVAGPFMKVRIRRLRQALGAFARAFAHESRVGDLELLERTANASPLVHWAMTYAAAVVAVDHGDVVHAKRLIQDAPPWPEGSAFREFQRELGAHLGGDGES